MGACSPMNKDVVLEQNNQPVCHVSKVGILTTITPSVVAPYIREWSSQHLPFFLYVLFVRIFIARIYCLRCSKWDNSIFLVWKQTHFSTTTKLSTILPWTCFLLWHKLPQSRQRDSTPKWPPRKHFWSIQGDYWLMFSFTFKATTPKQPTHLPQSWNSHVSR